MKKILFAILIMCFSLFFFGSVLSTSEAIENETDRYDDLLVLLDEYYNNGNYEKNTIIYADVEAISQDVSDLGISAVDLFHAGNIPTLERNTYYKKDALWMENGKNYSYYGSENGYLTSGKSEEKYVVPESLSIAAPSSSMENYYVTLKDFVDGTTGEKCNYGVLELSKGWVYNSETRAYENFEEDVLDAFRLFTAPLWLGKTEDNKNYISYSKATIQIDGNDLIMKLWVLNINSGIVTSDVVGEYMVFSQATITLPEDGEQGESDSMAIDKEITYNMARLTSVNGGQPLSLENGQVMFTDRQYVIDQNVAPSLYGKSYFYNSIESSKSKVVQDGYVIVVFPTPYTAIREQALNQGFEPLFTNQKPFGRRFIDGPMAENVDYYVKYCVSGEEINFTKWTIVIFETLSKEEYFIPEWLGMPADLVSDTVDLNSYDVSSRLWQGIPGVEKTESGRYFACYGSGGNKEPHLNNYTVYSYSDDGENWKDLMVANHSSSTARVFDASLWIDPTGKLWMFWSQGNGEIDGFIGVWAISINPNGTDSEMREAIANAVPRRIADGIKLNKPIVLSDGTWAFAVLDERSADYTSVYVSNDNGLTWTKRSTAIVTGCNHADEPIILELAENELSLYVRATDGSGIRVAYSHDNGYTWEDSIDSGLGGPGARFNITRLPSGNILLVNHYEYYGRSTLTALLSQDNGKTWTYSLLIDQRVNCSYPDVTVSDNGLITMTWDYERNLHGVIYMAEFTEEDIINGGSLSRDNISIVSEVTNENDYNSNILGDSDDFFATRGFVVKDGVATQTVGGDHEIYLKDVESEEFYVSTEITAEGVYNNDAYPKFGIYLRQGNQSMFFYIVGNNNLKTKQVGYAFRENWTWDWDHQVTKNVDINYTGGQYTKLAILSKNGQYVLCVNDEEVFVIDLPNDWEGKEVSVGLKTFNTKAHFINNFVTTDSELLEVFSGERATTVKGTVVDILGNPIVDATVSVGSQTVLTDKNGQYVLENVKIGESLVSIFASGFISQSSPWELKDSSEINNGYISLSNIVLVRDYVDMGSLTSNGHTWNFESTRNEEGFLYRFVSTAGASSVKNEVNIWFSVGSTAPDPGTTSGRNKGFYQFQFIREVNGTLSLKYRNAPKGSLGSFRTITSGITWTVAQDGTMTIECFLPYSMFTEYDSSVEVSSNDIVGMMYTIAIANKENATYIYTFADGTKHTSSKAKTTSILRIDANNYIFVNTVNEYPK